MFDLRDYQSAAAPALYDWFAKNDGNPLVVMPTGTGKSVVLSELIRQALTEWPDTRILVLTHVRELLTQNIGALFRIWPEAPAGLYSAGLGQRDIAAQILFAGIQSIHSRAYDVQRCDLILIDEAHLIGRKVNGMYRRFIAQLLEINPDLKIVGFTATPFRTDSGLLHEGEDKLFHGVAYEVSVLPMIEQGYLCPVVPKDTKTQIDVSDVGTKGGEFIAAQLEAAADRDAITLGAVDEIVTAGEGRGSWMIFCSGVDHAEHVRDAFHKWGITCEAISGETPTPERDRVLREFKAGRIRAITSMNTLTTGFDAPGVDLVAFLRPTKSPGLYIQMLGRGMRTAPGKDDCLVLDFAGNTHRLGTIDTVYDRIKRKGKAVDGQFPAKTCPECKTIVPAGRRECDCGYEFPPPEKNPEEISQRADTKALLSTQVQSEWVDVTGMGFARHEKPGKPPSLRVDYSCGVARHAEWVCFEHTGYPRQKACAWWAKRAPGTDIPATVDEAHARWTELRQPSSIMVKPQGQYTEITGVRF